MSKNPDSDPGYEVLSITSDPGSESKSQSEKNTMPHPWMEWIHSSEISCTVTLALLKYPDSDPGYEVANITVAPWVRVKVESKIDEVQLKGLVHTRQ